MNFMRLILPFCMIFFLITGCQTSGNDSETTTQQNPQTMEVQTKKLRHVVMFQFKETSSDEDIRKIEDAFGALPSQISEIKAYEWGTNNSPEGLNQGLTHCFLVTFESEEDRDAYLPHPAHQAFVEILEPHLEKAVVLDYWAND